MGPKLLPVKRAVVLLITFTDAVKVYSFGYILQLRRET
jgi:hypothetical protein